MLYFKNTQNTTSAYNHSQVLYPAGINKIDSYSINSFYTHNINEDTITSKHEVVKNWSCNELPKGQEPKEGKRYREILFQGTVKECYEFIDDIAQTEGYWIQDPNNPFEQIFIEPVK